MYDIIVFENLRFRPSTRKRKARAFKTFHSAECFWKDAFSMTVFTGYMWTVDQTRDKNIRFQKQKKIRGDEASV